METLMVFYNFDFFQDKEKDNYILNCLSKDITEYEQFVTAHISSSANIYKALLNNVEMAVNECISNYQVHLYGSHATNLCLPWSDLDIVLIPKNMNRNCINENNHALLSKLYENLRNKKWVKDINYISNASIPIIKIYTIETFNNIPIDISIQEEKHFGLKCVELVKQYMNQFESLKPLVLSLKNILKRANLNDPYKGGISSYGLILMIVYFLKQQSFAGRDISLGENNSNLGQLFLGFLHFYSHEFEIEKNIINALEKIKDSEKEHKAELEPLKIEHANEIKMSDDKKCYLIQISTQNLPGFKKVHSLLTQKLEEHLSNAVMIIPARKRVNGKEYRTYVSKKVPRDRTLSAVFDSYLDDILYPATIIGKRIRYPVGKTTRTYKVIVDSLDKESISDRLDAMKACYKALTNRKLDIEF